jgi:hypothetical protein
MRASTQHGLSDNCRNCGADFAALEPPPLYCSQCGQDTTLHPPSLREFLHEFVGHYVALEGPLWRTLGLLLTRPGRLTQEYLAGRRRRYVLPLRLYLTASFLFFVIAKVLPGAPAIHIQGPTDPALSAEERAEAAADLAQAAAVASAARAAATRREDSAPVEYIPSGNAFLVHRQRCKDVAPTCNRLELAIDRAATQWRDHPDESAHAFGARLASALPYALFLMLPVFAALMMLAYRNRHMVYGEHVVFGLHLHAFWFLAMLVASAVPEGLGWCALPIVFAYGLVAMHRVYSGRWSATFWRAIFVSGSYLMLLAIGTLVLIIGVWLLG